MSTLYEYIRAFLDFNCNGYLALVIICIVLRIGLKKKDLVEVYLQAGGLILAATSAIGLVAYMLHIFTLWHIGNSKDTFYFVNRAFGPYAWAYWPLIFGGYIVPLLLWWPKVRRNLWVSFIIAVLVGCWPIIERVIVIIISMHRDFLPSSWSIYQPRFTLALLISDVVYLMVILLFVYLPRRSKARNP